MFLVALVQMPHYFKVHEGDCEQQEEVRCLRDSQLIKKLYRNHIKETPQKLKDLGSFTFPCIIGEHTFGKALSDLGAIINLMPLSASKKLNLGKITPTSLSL